VQGFLLVTDAMIPQPEPAPGDPAPGSPAATSVTTAEPPKCPTRTRFYRRDRLVEEGFPAEELSERLDAHPDGMVWLDLHDPDEADLAIVTGEFGLHPLAVEDAVHDHQRPKLDRYPTHLFANMYAVGFDDGTGELRTSEISAFIMPRALITVRKADFDIDTLVARWDATNPPAGAGVGFLVHGLLDAIADGQYEAAQQLDDAIDDLEDALFDPQTTVDIRRRGFELRKSLVGLRRVVVPMRDLVGRLLRTDDLPNLVTPQLLPYYQDVYDHVLRSAENVETARELVSSILDTSLNEQSQQLNEITKKLAAWAAIIAVPTAVTGFYGKNVPYHGFGHWTGFVTSTLLIVVLAGGLYLLLRRRGWL
jgi:magnesium transporter